MILGINYMPFLQGAHSLLQSCGYNYRNIVSKHCSETLLQLQNIDKHSW